jgi:hypothetical protein
MDALLVSVMGLNEPFSHHIVDCVGCLAIKIPWLTVYVDRSPSRSDRGRGLDYLRSDSCLRWKPAGGLTPNIAFHGNNAETYCGLLLYHTLIEKVFLFPDTPS